MPTKNLLRTLIVLQFAVWIGQRVAADLSIRRLISYFGIQLAYISPLGSLFGRAVDSAVFLGLFAALLIAGIGLCLFWTISRALYLVVMTLQIVLALVHGPLVRSGSMDFFYSANILLTGVILTVVYGSPLKDLYGGRSHEQTPVNVMPERSPAIAVNPPPPALTPDPGREQEIRRTITNPEGAAPFCGACGASTQGAKFCPQCGKPLATRKQCSRCGVESESGEKFCRECGNSTP